MEEAHALAQPRHVLAGKAHSCKSQTCPGAEALVLLDLDLFAGIEFSNPSVEV